MVEAVGLAGKSCSLRLAGEPSRWEAQGPVLKQQAWQEGHTVRDLHVVFFSEDSFAAIYKNSNVYFDCGFGPWKGFYFLIHTYVVLSRAVATSHMWLLKLA